MSGETLDGALVRAGRGVGKPLALAAAATAAGFFSFLPTSYAGVAELGLIAGIGMVIAFILAITMLPGADQARASARRTRGDRIFGARRCRPVSGSQSLAGRYRVCHRGCWLPWLAFRL